MKYPLVSVIIPTYSRPQMLSRAIDSVLKQTYPEIEIIVVDDNGKGSQFQIETSGLIEQYKNHVTYVVHESNKGGSAARNSGWRIARGKYITFLDDDDEISIYKIERQVNTLEHLSEEWGACYTAYHILMADGKVQKSDSSYMGDVYIRALMRTLYVGSGSNLLLRKNVVDKVCGYDEAFKRNQDVEFMTRVFKEYKLAYVSEDLLTIHCEVREFKRDFEFLDNVSLHYLNAFADHINLLSEQDRKRVISVISLDRARLAISYKKFPEAINILKENNVSLLITIKYVCHILRRLVTRTSYGFYY